MAKRKYPPIKTISYCYVNGVKTCTDDLTPEQQYQLGSKIQQILAENLFRGQVVFHPEQTQESKS